MSKGLKRPGVAEVMTEATQSIFLNALVKFRGPFKLTPEEVNTPLFGSVKATLDEKEGVELTFVESNPTSQK